MTSLDISPDLKIEETPICYFTSHSILKQKYLVGQAWQEGSTTFKEVRVLTRKAQVARMPAICTLQGSLEGGKTHDRFILFLRKII